MFRAGFRKQSAFGNTNAEVTSVTVAGFPRLPCVNTAEATRKPLSPKDPSSPAGVFSNSTRNRCYLQISSNIQVSIRRESKWPTYAAAGSGWETARAGSRWGSGERGDGGSGGGHE